MGLLKKTSGKKKDLLLFGLLGEEHSLDIGQDTSLSNGDTREKLVEFLVVADGQLQVTRDDTGLLVVSGGISCQLEYLSCKILHDGCQVNGSTRTYTLGIVSLTEETVNPTDGELKSSPARAGL